MTEAPFRFELPIKSVVDVRAARGPSEVTGRVCQLLRLPIGEMGAWDGIDVTGASCWACFRCGDVVVVRWAPDGGGA